MNALTVDLEDWYQGNEYILPSDAHRYENRIEIGTRKLLHLLAESGAQATFFILGHIAEKNSALIRSIADAGHEIATRGYSHQLIYRQKPSEFEAELRRAKQACEDIVGHPIIGHRASNWSITRSSLWALDILRNYGFLYDSSIFPARTYLYGIPDAPRFAHHLENGLLEIPPSTLKWGGRRIPFSGGFFLRVFPLRFLRWAIRQINAEGHPAVIYVHPWELDVGQPRSLDIPLKNRFIHYAGLRSTEGKLRSLLSLYSFGRMDRVFRVSKGSL